MKVVPVITAKGETVAVRVITAVCLVTAALVATEGGSDGCGSGRRGSAGQLLL